MAGRIRRFASFEALAEHAVERALNAGARVVVDNAPYRVEAGHYDPSATTRVIVLTAQGEATDHRDTLESAMTQHGLTQREAETAILLARRYRNAEIAQRLGVSAHTARHHTRRVMAKLNARTRLQVARLIRAG